MKKIITDALTFSLFIITFFNLSALAAPKCDDTASTQLNHTWQSFLSKQNTSIFHLNCGQRIDNKTIDTNLLNCGYGKTKALALDELKLKPICNEDNSIEESANNVGILCADCEMDKSIKCRDSFHRTNCEPKNKGTEECVFRFGKQNDWQCCRGDSATITFSAACHDDVCDGKACLQKATNANSSF